MWSPCDHTCSMHFLEWQSMTVTKQIIALLKEEWIRVYYINLLQSLLDPDHIPSMI